MPRSWAIRTVPVRSLTRTDSHRRSQRTDVGFDRGFTIEYSDHQRALPPDEIDADEPTGRCDLCMSVVVETARLNPKAVEVLAFHDSGDRIPLPIRPTRGIAEYRPKIF